MSWPQVLTGRVATMELLQRQFCETERAPREVVHAQQLQQITALAAHAHAHSPFWRARLEAAGFPDANDWFARLPILTRIEAKAGGQALLSVPVPEGHGKVGHVKTSGSTGTPMVVAKTQLALLFSRAITLRDALWHRRDLRGKLASIRVGASREQHSNWGSAYQGYDNGPSVSFDAREDVDTQLDWLVAEQPNVLLTHPSNLRALALRSQARGCVLPGLQEVRTYSECLPEDLRALVLRAWNTPLTDIYSANEVGYVALQCPQSGLYHVQSEDVLVEILDTDCRPCAPGASGRVVVTSLHNYAMPLLRYDLGDYATVAHACPCGRTLPTLERILGRVRNMLLLPDGRTAWPGFPMNTLVKLQAIRELRMIQHSLTEIELELALTRALTSEEQSTLIEAVKARLRHPFAVRLTEVTHIARGPGAKREDFECRVN